MLVHLLGWKINLGRGGGRIKDWVVGGKTCFYANRIGCESTLPKILSNMDLLFFVLGVNLSLCNASVVGDNGTECKPNIGLPHVGSAKKSVTNIIKSRQHENKSIRPRNKF